MNHSAERSCRMVLAEDLQLTDVIARGKFVMQDGTIVKKGRYEL